MIEKLSLDLKPKMLNGNWCTVYSCAASQGFPYSLVNHDPEVHKIQGDEVVFGRFSKSEKGNTFISVGYSHKLRKFFRVG